MHADAAIRRWGIGGVQRDLIDRWRSAAAEKPDIIFLCSCVIFVISRCIVFVKSNFYILTNLLFLIREANVIYLCQVCCGGLSSLLRFLP